MKCGGLAPNLNSLNSSSRADHLDLSAIPHDDVALAVAVHVAGGQCAVTQAAQRQAGRSRGEVHHAGRDRARWAHGVASMVGVTGCSVVDADGAVWLRVSIAMSSKYELSLVNPRSGHRPWLARVISPGPPPTRCQTLFLPDSRVSPRHRAQIPAGRRGPK